MSQRSPFNKRNMPKAPETEAPAGVSRKSAARAKPARAAAQSVRVVSASSSKSKPRPGTAASMANMTKDQKKAKRRAEREQEDMIVTVANVKMREDDTYVRFRRIWWVLLVAGMVFVFVSFAAGTLGRNAENNMYDVSTTSGLVAVVSVVLAYALIIGALVFEFVKIRPIRNAALSQVRGMTEKKRRAVMERSYEEDERRRAEKAARKAAKKK